MADNSLDQLKQKPADIRRSIALLKVSKAPSSAVEALQKEESEIEQSIPLVNTEGGVAITDSVVNTLGGDVTGVTRSSTSSTDVTKGLRLSRLLKLMTFTVK